MSDHIKIVTPFELVEFYKKVRRDSDNISLEINLPKIFISSYEVENIRVIDNKIVLNVTSSHINVTITEDLLIEIYYEDFDGKDILTHIKIT